MTDYAPRFWLNTDQRDNVEDCITKGRFVYRPLLHGETHPAAKVTDDQISLMLSLRVAGATYGEIADQFNICKAQARRLCVGESRCHHPTI